MRPFQSLMLIAIAIVGTASRGQAAETGHWVKMPDRTEDGSAHPKSAETSPYGGNSAFAFYNRISAATLIQSASTFQKLYGFADARGTLWQQRYIWVDCQKVPANDQFEVKASIPYEFEVKGDSSNYWYTAGSCAAQAAMTVVISTSPDASGSNTASGLWYGQAKEDVPFHGGLGITWPPTNFAWLGTPGDDFSSGLVSATIPVLSNISNLGQTAVSASISLAGTVDTWVDEGASFATASIYVRIANFTLTKL